MNPEQIAQSIKNITKGIGNMQLMEVYQCN